MPQRQGPHRQCRDFEREWQDRCVDRGLEDSWLDRLNRLTAFDLISVCEGHPSRQSDAHSTMPHIKLRLREAFLAEVTSQWDDHKLAVVDTVARLFQTGDTYVNLELKLRLRTTTNRLNYQEDMLVRIHRRHRMRSEAMGTGVRDWFDGTVPRVEELDTVIAHLWYNADQRHVP